MVNAILQVIPVSASLVPVLSSKSSSHRLCYRRDTIVVKTMLQQLPMSASLVPVLPPSGCKFQTFIDYLTRRRIDRSREFMVRSEQSDTEFEIDRVKAKEALKDLDQQLLNLSQRQIPKTRSLSSLEADIKKREPIAAGLETEDVPDVSGSYLAYIATFLVVITVLNNIAFNIFIKPSVDNKGPPPASASAKLFQEEIRQVPTL
ncbi:uncharacterized protein LOC116256128 isoform X1 [Nymphaea colorata]|nr:uncharacterized protein LOC116256128 isoform X1 [Nymphaea colorata]XP_031488216.1 uncharacterized protein LOC116256128 isoform X1 [Nymphaea colorata]XP_049934425.1 uncharacterized protein LOC116256128 isoform X1 [Nymphaea colorata]